MGWEDPLEKATHSSILAWRIPWTEEPGGLVNGVAKESDTTELAYKLKFTQDRPGSLLTPCLPAPRL